MLDSGQKIVKMQSQIDEIEVGVRGEEFTTVQQVNRNARDLFEEVGFVEEIVLFPVTLLLTSIGEMLIQGASELLEKQGPNVAI